MKSIPRTSKFNIKVEEVDLRVLMKKITYIIRYYLRVCSLHIAHTQTVNYQNQEHQLSIHQPLVALKTTTAVTKTKKKKRTNNEELGFSFEGIGKG